MKKIIALSAVLSLMIVVSTKAQKLPNIQEKSVRAPATIKIDGKRPEWDNQIQAINKATSILYTISNDNDKLYLVVLAADLDIATKLINAGLTFTIHSSAEKKDENEIAITFPFLYYDDFDNKVNGAPAIDYRGDTETRNKKLTSMAKDIRVAGIKGVKDTLSIYNQEGIKVAALFGEDEVLTYELAIPLKYLGLSVKEPKLFSYTIRLNGAPNYAGKGLQYNLLMAARRTRYGGSGIRGFSIPGDQMSMYGPNADIIKGLISPTYFSGEYTLAK